MKDARIVGPWVLLVLAVAASSYLFLRHLGNDYITLWDEAVHVNVIQNLMTDCCTPKLHLHDYQTNSRDWTDSYVWLHKPALPFYLNASVSWALGGSLWAIRFASYLLAEIMLLTVFWAGRRFFDTWSGSVAALLMAFNHYTVELVQGRQFSGVVDLSLTCFLLCALCFLLAVSETPKKVYFIGFGVCVGLAFLCKDGLALIPFAILPFVVFAGGWRRHGSRFALVIVSAVAVVLPEKLYLAARFPAQVAFEQRSRLAHLWSDVEDWSRAPDYYFTTYYQEVTSPLLVVVGLLCMAYGFRKFRHDLRVAILAGWVAAYMVSLTFVASKVSNFVYPAVPVLYLLIAVVLVRLWRRETFHVIVAAAASVVVAELILRLNLFGSARWVGDSPVFTARMALVCVECVLFGAALGLIRLSRMRITRGAAFVMVVLAIDFVAITSARASLESSNHHAADFADQMKLRQAALAVRTRLSPDSVLLVKWHGLPKSHLYAKYWSGLDSFEVRDSVDARLGELHNLPAVHLLSDVEVPELQQLARAGPAYVYKLR